jgi:hypothetical protein
VRLRDAVSPAGVPSGLLALGTSGPTKRLDAPEPCERRPGVNGVTYD